jgi:hypothetical protein
MGAVRQRFPPARWLLVIAVGAVVLVLTALALGATVDPGGSGKSSGDRVGASAVAARASCGRTRPPFGPGRWPGGCWRPYGSSSPFNQRLPSNPRLAPGSAAMVSRLLGFGPIQNQVIGTADTSEDYSHPVYFARRKDPVYRLSCNGRYGRCPVHGLRVRVPARARPAAGSDAHLAVVDPSLKREYDLYEVTSKPRKGGLLRFTFGGSTKVGGAGLRAGATAAGYGLMAGTIRASELARGAIKHALFVTILCDNGTRVYPASGVGRPCSAIGRSMAGAPPMGTRLQLVMSPSAIKQLSAPRWARAILLAMSRYGMFVGDTGGSSWGLQLESGTTYTSFGYRDPLVSFARRAALPSYDRFYTLSVRNLVDWRRLRVIDPCVSKRTC